MGRHVIETIMGAVVLAVAAGFLIFAYNQSSLKSVDGYSVKAAFNDISGIGLGSDVRIGGLKVGVVEALVLDPATYQASAVLRIRDNIKLPKDTSAAIASEGLLGGKFIKLEPGGSDNELEDGGLIKFTQSSVSFEELIGKFVFSGGGVDGKDEGGSPEKKPAPKSEGTEEEKSNPFSLGF